MNYGQSYYRKNKAKIKEAQWAYELKRKFGITTVQYYSMLAEQAGTCAICHNLPTKRKLNVDHDHKTGNIRGLLCHNCNVALGLLKENPRLFSAAVAYLDGRRLTRYEEYVYNGDGRLVRSV